MRALVVLGLIAAGTMAAPAASQTADIRGQWTAEEGGRTCTVNLAGTQMFGTFGASSFACFGSLTSLNGYRVMGSEVVLTAIGGRELARLRPLRDGRLSNGTITLARANAAPVLTLPQPRRSDFSDCIRYGRGDRCATPVELQLPRDGSSVRVLADVMVRREPRLTAQDVGVLRKDMCVPVHQCIAGPEGLWCSVTVDGRRGWSTKVFTAREGQTMMYANGCG